MKCLFLEIRIFEDQIMVFHILNERFKMSNKINMKTVDGLVEGLNGKAGVDLANSPYTTNRILEIPQDIKLELNNGTLTLKAGSRVYVPNGFESDGTTPHYDIVTIDSDRTLSSMGSATGQCFLFWNKTGNSWGYAPPGSCTVGTTPPSNGTFWNTTTNTIKYYENGSDLGRLYCLPFALVTRTSGTPISIDQVFNGLGYIGLVAFALPGIKIQYVQGTNIDGTYNTGVATTTMLSVSLSAAYPNSRGCLLSYSPSTQTFGLRMAYEIGNMSMVPRTGRKYSFMFCEQDGWFYVTENTTTYSKSTQVFVKLGWFYQKSATEASVKIDMVNAINTYSRSELSGLGMPSSKYEDWTLGASGATYIAPANGYLMFSGSTTGNQGVDLRNKSANMLGMVCQQATQNQTVRAFVPCKKGDLIVCSYSVSNNLLLRFVYAEGEV